MALVIAFLVFMPQRSTIYGKTKFGELSAMSIGILVRSLIDSYQSLPVQPFRPTVRSIYRLFQRGMQGRQSIETIDGVRFDLDLSEMIESALYYYGAFEKETKAALNELCRPGFTVFDIGANIGAHTLFLGTRVQPGGQVFAFEPATYAFTKLSRNLALNSSLPVRAFRLGLGTIKRENWATDVSCSWPVDKDFKRLPDQVMPNAYVRKDRIDILPLDEFVKIHAITSLDLIKLDVDGHEIDVIKSGRDTIRRFKPVLLVEFCDFTLRAYGSSLMELYNELVNLGYEFFSLDLWKPFQVRAIAELEQSKLDSVNVVAVHKDDDREPVRARYPEIEARASS